MRTKVLTVEVPAPLAEQIGRLAVRQDRSQDSVVREALTAWADREERFRALTLEGLADVDAGRLVEQATMEAWADSLDTDAPSR
ncbi:CopG family transcriptional regulator [Caulobacter flavus]|uniref:CopG family transcriptional regulator n=1 Tax=Caulobacter flavus TaxID=1679497 RepID=A0A2N5CXF7_9CAUL|nr:CopG family transcriptional regulator [Caulobacter flavus]AYV49635.1 CopG family transcriptional regulator [Caulobacter flavus]PLR18497.1 CopG family transcriptional regulator [Caulobacter flavus]